MAITDSKGGGNLKRKAFLTLSARALINVPFTDFCVLVRLQT